MYFPKRLNLYSTLVISLLFTGVGFTAPSSQRSENNPRSLRADLKYMGGKGVGYKNGYTSLDLFLTSFNQGVNDSLLPFIDLRGHYFDNGKWAANVGGGLRQAYESGCVIFGENIYYDYRQSSKKSYHQIGLGVEALWATWELRANGYIPVGSRKSSASYQTSSTLSFDHFAGNTLYALDTTTGRKKTEFDMAGVDAEIGIHPFNFKRAIDLYFAAGPYYYTGPYKKNTVGVQTRVYAMLGQHIGVQASYSYDHLFNNIVQGEITISIPFGPRFKSKKNGIFSQCARPGQLKERMVQPVYRHEIIVLDKHYRNTTSSQIINTNTPFVFVNNTSGGGAGTFESPYNTLALAQAVSTPTTVYVFPGDGTTTGMDVGFTLKNGQSILGSGAAQNITTPFGPVVVPALTTTLPNVTSTTTHVIFTLASQNTISGFHFTQPSSMQGFTGIFGLTINGPTVISNNFFDTLDHAGVDIEESSGLFTITNNTSQGIITDVQSSDYYFLNHTGNIMVDFANNVGTNGRVGFGAASLQSGMQIFNLTNGSFTNYIESGYVFQAGDTSYQKATIGGGFISQAQNNEGILMIVGTNNVPNDAARGVYAISGMTLSTNPIGGVRATVNSNSSLCLKMADNTNDSTYKLQNLNAPNSTLTFDQGYGNTGTFIETGTITLGSCE